MDVDLKKDILILQLSSYTLSFILLNGFEFSSASSHARFIVDSETDIKPEFTRRL